MRLQASPRRLPRCCRRWNSNPCPQLLVRLVQRPFPCKVTVLNSDNDGPLENGALQLAKGENAAPAAPGLPIMAAAPTTQHRISNVRELLATGLLEGERVMYRQKTRTSYKIMLEGRIKGVLYSCLCHDEAMSAAQFELHAKCKSNNPNDHIFCFGKSLYTIVSHLRTKAVEEQSSVLLKLKEESEGTKEIVHN
ncbi:unnamed protein product [Urochloa decumbens]|uniref:Tify domain-containing protein n=1 Tax=Urochloa decumbens TaxID=240449 RepID=A0ABC8XCW6_9POAL